MNQRMKTAYAALRVKDAASAWLSRCWLPLATLGLITVGLVQHDRCILALLFTGVIASVMLIMWGITKLCKAIIEGLGFTEVELEWRALG